MYESSPPNRGADRTIPEFKLNFIREEIKCKSVSVPFRLPILPSSMRSSSQSSRASRMKRAPSWLHCTRRRISTVTCRSKCRRRLHAVSMYLSKRSTAFPRSILSSRSLRRANTTFPFASAPHATLRAQIRFSTVSLQSSASSRRNVRRTACSRSPHVAASAPAALHRSSPSTKTFTAVSFPRTWISTTP